MNRKIAIKNLALLPFLAQTKMKELNNNKSNLEDEINKIIIKPIISI